MDCKIGIKTQNAAGCKTGAYSNSTTDSTIGVKDQNTTL